VILNFLFEQYFFLKRIYINIKCRTIRNSSYEHCCLIDLKNLQEYYQELIDPIKLYKKLIEVKLGYDIDLFLRKLEILEILGENPLKYWDKDKPKCKLVLKKS
jgi:hypothetical protein